MARFLFRLHVALLAISAGYGQSPPLNSYMNPVIPGDHPDCTISKIGHDFYTTGFSFNFTPVSYHSTDLVHWQAINQPVSASWSAYGDTPSGGCWGGRTVLYNGVYWHFFSRANTMYFVKAANPRGPWSLPVMVKNGKANNGIVEHQLSAGKHKVNWNAGGLASGVYLYRLEAGGLVQNRKLLLIQ